MKCKTNQSITSLLQNVPDLQKFVGRIEQLKQISEIISSKLEPSLADNCHVANLRDGTLILATTSPVWNHKLRFSALDLLSALRSDPRWSGLKSIEVRVDYSATSENTSVINPNKPREISASGARSLLQAAESINNPQLALALVRVARRRHPDASH